MFTLVVAAVGVALIIWRLETMTEKLTAAIAALQGEVEDTNGKLASIKTFILGVPALAAAAVADALAAHDVEDDAAADAIDAARSAVSDSVDDTISAIDANPTPAEEGGPTVAETPVEEAPGGTAAGTEPGTE